MSEAPALLVEDLSVEFRTRNGVVRALDRVSFEARRGQVLALVGESGSGKSVTAFAIMGLLDQAGRVTSGRALLDGEDLLSLDRTALAKIRGKRIAMVFQNPRAALNPIRAVGQQIADVLRRHEGLSPRAASAKAVELLSAVGITDPSRRAQAYPFEMSGGMCQRAMIAIALAARPAVLIADEPTTGLDVTTQATILDLIEELGASIGMATIFITHDLALAAERAQRIVVMHAGHVVETAPTTEIFAAPRHPYTAELLAATPAGASQLEELASIPGGLPDLRRTDLPACRYAARCARKLKDCDMAIELVPASAFHAAACLNPLL